MISVGTTVREQASESQISRKAVVAPRQGTYFEGTRIVVETRDRPLSHIRVRLVLPLTFTIPLPQFTSPSTLAGQLGSFKALFGSTLSQHIMADNTQPPSNLNMEMNDPLDPSIEADISQDATQPDAMNLDGANDAEPATRNGVAEVTTSLEARIPAKKDATLREFLGKMDEYAPIVCRSPGHRRWTSRLDIN